MTLIQVIDAARSIINAPLDSTRTFPDDSSNFWGDTTLTTYHNIVQEELAGDLVQTFEDYFVTSTTFNIVSGQVEYSLPSDFIKARRVEDVRNGNAIEIRPITLNDKGEVILGLGLSGTIFDDGYFIKGTKLVFSDTPSFTQGSAVKMYYVKRLADLSTTAATATSEIPPEHHRGLVWGIAKIALQQQQSDNNFAALEYEKIRKDIMRNAEDRQVQRPRKVKETKARAFL